MKNHNRYASPTTKKTKKKSKSFKIKSFGILSFGILIGFCLSNYWAYFSDGVQNKLFTDKIPLAIDDSSSRTRTRHHQYDTGAAMMAIGGAGGGRGQQNKNALWQEHIARNHTTSNIVSQGNSGEEWNWCTHIVTYGPNFDRGFASFIASVLRPSSALEFGCGIGLYIDFIQRNTAATTAGAQKKGYFIGIEPEPMLDAGIFTQLPPPTTTNGDDDGDGEMLKQQALQLAINIFETDEDVLDSLPKFDVVYSSEVIEHIPAKFHAKLLDFLVSKTERFMIFGGARPGQGGHGHISESMKPKQHWIDELCKKRNMVYLKRVTERLNKQCYNAWDKGQNSFVVANPAYVSRVKNELGYDIDFVLGDQKNVYDIWPEFQQRIEVIKDDSSVCQSRRRRRLAYA